MSQERKTTAPPAERGAAEALLARPLSARSVIASLLLGTQPPRMPGAALVRWCGLFGIAEGTARVALSRMLARGELTAADGVYTLSGALRERQRHQEWSLRPRLLRWSGRWDLRAVRAGARSAAERQALRHAMGRQRLAELREGVWLRPANLPPESAPADALAVTEAQCYRMRAEPEADPETLVGELFDPLSWAARARMLAERLAEVTAVLSGGDLGRLAEGFVTGAAALAHVRSDPLLPPSLVEPDFPGADLRAGYLRYSEAYRSAAEQWFRSRT